MNTSIDSGQECENYVIIDLLSYSEKIMMEDSNMKVNHKTFSGGYRFDHFEGQPSKHITAFASKSDVAGSAIKSDKGVTATDVLNALGLTTFKGPETALVPTDGLIDPTMVKDIVVSTVEVEPYDFPNDVLLKEEHKTRFIDGLKSIRDSYHQASIHIVLDEDQTDLVHMLLPISDNFNWLDISTITAKYPANLKELLIPTVLDKKYPVGYAPAHLGILFLTVDQVLQVTKVVTENKDADTVAVALAGPGWQENLVLEVPLGTPLKAITDAYLTNTEVRLIKNSVITGDVLNETDLVTYDTRLLIALPEDRRRQTLFFLRAGTKADSFSNAFISRLMPKAIKTADTNLHGERRACVSCTYCQNVCPVGLMPQLLHKHVDKKIINKRLAEYKIFDCVECGLCDYVCPSKIEVSSDIKRGKEMLEKNEISHNEYVIPQCDMILQPKEVADNE